MVDVHARLIRDLEQHRRAEPRARVPAERDGDRRAQGRQAQGLTAPELAVVMAYCKIHLYTELLDSDLPEDPYLAHDLERYFPAPLPERYPEQMRGHRLRARSSRRSSPTSSSTARARPSRSASRGDRARRRRSSRGPTRSRARCSRCASFWAAVEALDNQVEAGTQLDDADRGAPAGRARDPLAGARRTRTRSSIAQTISALSRPAPSCSAAALPDVLEGADRDAFDARAGRAASGRRARRARPARARACRRCCTCSTSSRSPATTERDQAVVLRGLLPRSARG